MKISDRSARDVMTWKKVESTAKSDDRRDSRDDQVEKAGTDFATIMELRAKLSAAPNARET